MNVRALQCFIKVYERKSINAAAREVYLTPQGLSKIIKQLEIDLEAELFSRGSQGMEATESGEILYARARHLTYLMEDIKKELAVVNGSQGSLKVVLAHSAACLLGPGVLFRFAAENPRVQVRLQECSDDQALDGMVRDEADIGLVVGVGDDPDYCWEVLRAGRSVAVLPSGDPLASRTLLCLSDLEGREVVDKVWPEGSEPTFREACMDAGVHPLIRHDTTFLDSLHGLCRSHGLVGISADFLEEAWPAADLEVRPLRDGPCRSLSMVTRNRALQNRGLALFQEWVRKHLASLKGGRT